MIGTAAIWCLSAYLRIRTSSVRFRVYSKWLDKLKSPEHHGQKPLKSKTQLNKQIAKLQD